MKRRKITRVVCVSFLVICVLLSVSLLLFSIGMEGMRHSHPGPTEFDSYYWFPGIPTGLSLFWLLNGFVRTSKNLSITLTCITAAFSVWWLILAFDVGIEFAAAGIVFVVLSFFASWGARNLRPTEGNNFKRA